MKLRRVNLFLGFLFHGVLSATLLAFVLFLWYTGSKNHALDDQASALKALSIARGLQADIRSGESPEKMQDFFPEGACFLNTLYGMTWANLADRLPEEVGPAKALPEIEVALRGQATTGTISPFHDTSVVRGAFWAGQRAYLLGRYLKLAVPLGKGSDHVEEFSRLCHDISTAFESSPTHHIDSYEGMCWAADNATCAAALVLHDDLYGTTYSVSARLWADFAQSHGWADTRLPAGRIYSGSGQHVEPARGCANSYITGILAPHLPDVAASIYQEYVQHFQVRRFGRKVFREYPASEKVLSADVDSGPIVLGAGAAATGIGLAASRGVGDIRTENDIAAIAEMFGFPQQDESDLGAEREYLFGLLPIGDAFLAWAWSLDRGGQAKQTSPGPFYNWAFHGWAFAFTAIIVLQYSWAWRRGKRRWQAAR